MLSQDEEEMILAVRKLARSRFASRAAQHDEDSTFVGDNVDDLRELGVPGAFVPSRFGGKGFGAEALVRIVEEVAYGDGSTAVALNMHLFTADFLLLMPGPVTAGILSDIAANQACICGPGSLSLSELDTRGGGHRAVEDGDEVVINGRSGFASMSEGAKYVFVTGSIERGEGQPADLVFALPRFDTPGIINHRNWNGMGLRGTASHDIEFKDVRLARDQVVVVPAEVMAQFNAAAAQMPAERRQMRARCALGVLGVWLGLSQAALDFTTDYISQRYGLMPLAIPGGPPPEYRSDQPWAQARVGEMAHWVHTGRILLANMAASLATRYASPEEFSRALAHTIYHLRRMSEEVAMGAMKVCGAHAYVRSRPLERIYRDLTGCVVMAWKTDQLQHQLGLGALGRPFVVGGPIGV